MRKILAENGKRDRSGKRDKQRKAGQVRFWKNAAESGTGPLLEKWQRKAGQVRFWKNGHPPRPSILPISSGKRDRSAFGKMGTHLDRLFCQYRTCPVFPVAVYFNIEPVPFSRSARQQVNQLNAGGQS